MNKIPPRRKRRAAPIEKSNLSESSDDGEKESTNAKTRRSRSKSTEVCRKRGRPRKIPIATSNNETTRQKRYLNC